MKAAVLYGRRDLRVEEVDKPELSANDVLVKVRACGVCMTDLHMFTWEFPVQTPVILGHEFSGEIVKIGNGVEGLREGDRIAVDPILSCGNCSPCVAGRDNLCGNARSIGGAGNVVINGAFAEFVSVSAKAIGRIPSTMSFEQGAFVEPLGCCIHGLDKSRVKVGEKVILIGAGTIGLLLLQLVRLGGSSLTVVVDVKTDRLNLAKKLGADIVVNPIDSDLTEQVKTLTQNEGVDLCIECVGSPSTTKQALKVVRPGGRVIIFGVSPVNAEMNFSPFDIYFREIEINGTYAITRDSFRRSIALLSSNRIDVSSLITERFELNDIRRAFELAEKKEGLKKLIHP
jgi:NADPH2:quinone reductase